MCLTTIEQLAAALREQGADLILQNLASEMQPVRTSSLMSGCADPVCGQLHKERAESLLQELGEATQHLPVWSQLLVTKYPRIHA